MENKPSLSFTSRNWTNFFFFFLTSQGFVIVSALLVTALLQLIFDGKPPSHYCLMALPLVMTSIFIYQKYPYADKKKKD